MIQERKREKIDREREREKYVEHELCMTSPSLPGVKGKSQVVNQNLVVRRNQILFSYISQTIIHESHRKNRGIWWEINLNPIIMGF
jgi:hypothetical protein